MEAPPPGHPDALPRAYAAWRCRTLAAAAVATGVGLLVHGPTSEVRFDFEEMPSPWLLLGLAALVLGACNKQQPSQDQNIAIDSDVPNRSIPTFRTMWSAMPTSRRCPPTRAASPRRTSWRMVSTILT